MVELAHDEVIDLKETFRGKPSDALEYMCDGLLRQDKREGFEIDMATFGRFGDRFNRQVCFGCAATSTVQEVAGRNLDASNIHDRKSIGFDQYELCVFEMVINDVRLGSLRSLFDFCNLEIDPFEWEHLWLMNNENWKSCITKVRKVIREMRAKGI